MEKERRETLQRYYREETRESVTVRLTGFGNNVVDSSLAQATARFKALDSTAIGTRIGIGDRAVFTTAQRALVACSCLDPVSIWIVPAVPDPRSQM